MSVLSNSDTELGPSLGSPLSPIKSPKAAEFGSCQPGSVAKLGLSYRSDSRVRGDCDRRPVPVCEGLIVSISKV